RLPATARPGIRLGAPASVRTGGPAPARWDATVTRIAPEADPQTRTIIVFVDVAQADAARRYGQPDARDVLTPGMFVAGQVLGRQPTPRWIVPRRSIRHGRIMTVTDGRLRSLPIIADYGIEGE